MLKHIWLLILCILLGSCDTNNTISSTNLATSIWPINIGATWSIKTTAFDSSSNIVAISESAMEFRRDTVIAGERWFIKMGDQAKYTSREDGVYIWYADSVRVPIIFLPYPSNINSEIKTSEWYVKLISVDSTIVVDGVQNHCYAYMRKRYSTDEYLSTEFFKPGIGPLRYDDYAISVGGSKYLRLQIVLRRII